MAGKRFTLAALALLPLSLLAEDAAPRSGFVLSVGPAFGHIRKGFLTLPVAWSAGAPAVFVDVQRSSPRFQHDFRMGLGRSRSISTLEGRRPGDNSFGWVPAEYGFTWYCCRDFLSLDRLDWGFGARLEYLRLVETIDLQDGRTTREKNRFFGPGVQTAFRWRSKAGTWTAAARVSLSVTLPFLSRSVIDSDAVAGHTGGLFWARSDLALGLERALGRRWTVGIEYERAALGAVRTPGKDLALDFALSAANYLLSHLRIQAGYSW